MLTDYKAKIYKVSEVNARINQVLHANFTKVWVTGEISNLKIYHEAHIYFSLKDENSEISCVMFRRDRAFLDFTPQNGMEVLVSANVNFYEKQGTINLIVNYMETTSEEGLLIKKLNLLREALRKEGLFDVRYKKEIPKNIARLGIITSKEGAVLHDIIEILQKRNPFVEVYVLSATVQGEKAVQTIIKRIKEAPRYSVDVLILARGGGSREDLMVFNDESLVRAIFQCQIPIISAIGHAPDETLTDLVADRFAETPSVAAFMIGSDYKDYHNAFLMLKERLDSLFLAKINERQQVIHNYQIIIFQHFLKTKEKLLNYQNLLTTYQLHLQNAAQNFLKLRQDTLQKMALTLSLTDPQKILAKGYAIIESKEKIITSVSGLHANEIISISMKDGKIFAKIIPSSPR